jgi:hypothetical protein
MRRKLASPTDKHVKFRLISAQETEASNAPTSQPLTYLTRFLHQPVWLGPQSHSFFRRYGTNLPTSLTYIVQLPEAVHLGDLMRIWVRSATKIILPCSDFQGPTGAFRTPQDGWCFTKASPLSPDNPIPGGGCTSNKEERTLPRTPADVSEVGCVTALDNNRPKPEAINLRGQGQEY